MKKPAIIILSDAADRIWPRKIAALTGGAVHGLRKRVGEGRLFLR